MLSMVWQFVVLPGTHTVTVVNSVLTVLLAGPELTTTLATLEPVVVVVVVVVPVPDVPTLSPPPQDSTNPHAAAQSPTRHARVARISGFLRG
jgi:hypothetical protein